MIQLRLCFGKYFDKLNSLFHNKGSWEVFESPERKPDSDLKLCWTYFCSKSHKLAEQFSDLGVGSEPGLDKRFQEQLLQPVIDLFRLFPSKSVILWLLQQDLLKMIELVSALVISMENGLGSETIEGKDKMEVFNPSLSVWWIAPGWKISNCRNFKAFFVKIKNPSRNDVIFIPHDGTAAERFISRGWPLFQLK